MRKTINNHWQFFWLAIGMSILLSSSAIKPQTGDRILPWMAQTKSQISPQAWQKMTVDVRMLIGAPTDFLNLKANVMEVSQIETAEPEVGVLVKSTGHREELEALGAKVGSQIGDIFTIRIPIAKLPELANNPSVMSIAPSLKRRATLDASVVENKAKQVHQGQYTTTPPTYSGYTGKGVIVADISTGIDWRHSDFINDSNNTSRILSIWDQTLIPQSGEKGPAGFSYGVEYTQADINNELDGTPTGYVRSKDLDGHGTHVMGIIAGDGSATGGGLPGYTYVGMAPQADIIVIKSLLYDSQILDAVSYAMNKADQFGKPVAFNMSFGGHFGAHDGTSLLEQGIDLAVNRGKIVIAVSAGNEGTDAAHGAYIHAEGTVATGSTNTTTFVIPSYTPNSSAGNDFLEFNLWYQGNDNINVKVTTPNGYTWNASTGYDNNAGATATSDGAIYIDNASTGRDFNNNDRMCYILIWDYYSSQPPRAGTWTITVTGNNITEGGHYDAWLDFSQLGTNQAYFSASSGSNKELIGIPGTADKVITVAAHSTKTSWVDYSGATRTVSGAALNDLAYFSSPGPTRDDPGHIVGRQKPDISASGFGVVAARSADASWSTSSMNRNKDGVHLMIWGTSMSAPHIVGAAALMLEKNPTLTAQEIKSLLTANAHADAYTGSVPNLRWGYGKLDIAAVMQQVTPRQQAVDLFPSFQADDGLSGTTVSFKARVQNSGATNDSYNLTVSSHSWPTTIWNAAGTSQISSTGVINARSQLEILIKVQIPAGTQPSRWDTAVIRATSASNAAIADQISVVTRTPASLPWSDNFPSTKLDTIKWNFNGGPAELNSLGTNEPSSPYSLNLNGNERGGDEVQSQAIDLSGKAYVMLSFYYQRTGGGNAPESGDDLWVDYYDNSGNWVNLKQYLGSGSSMSSYMQEQILLPATAMHARFKIRFRNVGTPGPNDDWFIDNVAIAEMLPATIPWTDNFPTTTLDANKWPVNIGPAVVNSNGLNEPSAPYSLDLNGTDEVQSQPIDLAGKNNVALLYYYQKKGGGDSPESGNDLYIDYYNSSGNWVNLKQHLGSSPDMTAYQLEYVPLPTAAYYNGFRIRFRTTGDANSDDWFVDDVKIQILLPPNITWTPQSISVALSPTATTSRFLTIGNTGQGDLFFDLFVAIPMGAKANLLNFEPATRDYPDNYFSCNFLKDESDFRHGAPVLLRRGGPDSYGHFWRDSDEPGGPSFNWVEISTSGTPITGLGDDTNVGPFDIGFSFPFFGNNFSSFRFCTNGFISFSSTSTSYQNNPIPNNSVYNLVAPFWDDLDFRTSGSAFYKFDGEKLIVEYKDVPLRSNAGGPYTFEILLYRDGRIKFQYLTMGSPVNSCTVGIQNANGTDGLEIAFNTSYLHNNMAILIYAYATNWLSFKPTSGHIPPGGNLVDTLSFNTTGLTPDSTYQVNLVIRSNDEINDTVQVPIELKINSPDISSTPSAINVALSKPDSIRQAIMLTNNGTGNLQYQLGVIGALTSSSMGGVGIVANYIDRTLHTIDLKSNTIRGPFLSGSLGSSNLLDVAITPDNKTALISNGAGNQVYFVNIDNPAAPTIQGKVDLGFFAEDIAITPDGRFALVSDGANDTKIAVVGITSRTLSTSINLTPRRVQSIAIAADGQTVLAADYNNARVHVLRLNPITGTIIDLNLALVVGDGPINVSVSPDGQTALVANYSGSSISVLRITAPGEVSVVASIPNLSYPQSIAFSPDGISAYVLETGTSPDRLAALTISGAGQVTDTGQRATLIANATGGFYGIDVIAISANGSRAYVGNSSSSGTSTNKVAVVELNTMTMANSLSAGNYPVAVALSNSSSWLSVAPPANGEILPNGTKSIELIIHSKDLAPDSTYHGKVLISSNDPDESLVTIPVKLTVTSGPHAPKHFVFRANTEVSYSIIIDAATLDQLPLQVGDEIGVFTPAGLCVGASVWTSALPLPLVAWMDDNQTSVVDGYRVGEKMFFRIWDASGGATAEYPAIPTYTAGNGNFGDGPFARIAKLEALTSAKQTIYLTRGWNWISTNVEPETLNVAAVTRKVLNLVIMVNGNGQFYIPGVVNAIGNYNVREGYKVYVSANDSLVILG